MITQEAKDNLIQAIKSLVESDFTALDVCCFVRDNKTVKEMLRKYPCCEYKDQLYFLEYHSDAEIEYVLNTPFSEYHDPEYGSLDPLIGMGVSKSEFEEDGEAFLFENLPDYDNVLSHLLYMLEKEPLEIPSSEILSVDSLQKLLTGEYDFPARQIYYFEQLPHFDSFCFWHYFRTSDDCWDYKKWTINFDDYREFVSSYCEEYDDADEIECHFYYDIENSYLGQLDWIEQDTPLSEAVYNGVEAVRQLKKNTIRRLRSIASAYQKNRQREEEKLREGIIDSIIRCTDALSLFDMPIERVAEVIARTENLQNVLTVEMFCRIDQTLKEKDTEIRTLREKLNRIRSVLDVTDE